MEAKAWTWAVTPLLLLLLSLFEQALTMGAAT